MSEENQEAAQPAKKAKRGRGRPKKKQVNQPEAQQQPAVVTPQATPPPPVEIPKKSVVTIIDNNGEKHVFHRLEDTALNRAYASAKLLKEKNLRTQAYEE